MENIKTIKHFDSAYALLDYVYGDGLKDHTTEKERGFLQGMNDLESFGFYLVNDDFVIVAEGYFGEVNGNVETTKEFFENTINYVHEEMTENEQI